MSKITTVLGAGSWGLTLAQLWSSGGRAGADGSDGGRGTVRVYCRNQDTALRLSETRLMTRPRIHQLAAEIEISSDLAQVLAGADVLVFACSSQSMRALANDVAAIGYKGIVVSATKGLELGTQMRMSQVLGELLGDCANATLSGPNLAEEVLSGLPTASVVASTDRELARALQERLSAPKFRVYASDDQIGVELGGTLKNVIAIAAGACDGLSLGVNAKAALLTRGLAEITRLAMRLGARPQTMAGLAGMGDLFATCSSPLSRNYRLGFELARGKALQTILEELGSVAEGVPTTEAVCELSKKLGLELPIAEQVESTLKGNSTPAGAIMALLSRPLASE